jgi:aminoglycoside 3-N-acetyltransferase
VSHDYTRDDMVRGLRACGIREGMVIFSHSNVGYFGRLEGARSLADICGTIYGAIREVLGESGTLVVPAYSYSFGSDKPQKLYDVTSTPSICGAFTEYVRRLPEARRSADPMFSVAAAGGQAEPLTRSVGVECFGEESFWRRFLDRDGMVCNLNLDSASTFIHFIERRLGVPYRENRRFAGTLVEDGVAREAEAVHFCHDLAARDKVAAFERFDELARAAGYVKSARVGRGAIVAMSARDTVRVVEDTIGREPLFLTTGGAAQRRAQRESAGL